MPYKQKDGTWRAVKMIDGQRKTKRFRTQSEAKRWEAEQNANLWAKERRPILTAFSLAEAYMNHVEARFSRQTYLEKRLAFQNLFRFVNPKCPADDIQARDILAALSHRAKGSGNAANKDRKNLHAAWEWGRDVFGLETNPFARVKRWRHDEAKRHMPTEEDFWEAYAAAGEDDKVFLLAALHTAARKSELFRLLWSDVDLDAGKIRLGTRKTADGGMTYAWLPLTSMLRGALVEHRKRSMRGLHVFTTQDGEPYKYRLHYMRRLCARAGVQHFGFHGVRHLSASLMAKSGVDIPTIQAILRHRSPNTTARYLRSLGLVDNVLEDVFTKTKAPGRSKAEG